MAKKRFYKKRIFKVISILLVLLVLFIVCCNLVIVKKAGPKCYDNTANIPENHVGLLLGTSPYLKGGSPNLYFRYRMQAAVDLYLAGKIKYILVSGDNGRSDYNEPLEMKNALIAKGVPENKIFLDYAGFRTLDSVVRAKEIFGQTSVTIISQKFHNQRAVYIAGWHGIDAVGYNAQNVTLHYGFKTTVREWLARVKVFVDLAVRKKPKFLGESIQIPE